MKFLGSENYNFLCAQMVGPFLRINWLFVNNWQCWRDRDSRMLKMPRKIKPKACPAIVQKRKQFEKSNKVKLYLP